MGFAFKILLTLRYGRGTVKFLPSMPCMIKLGAVTDTGHPLTTLDRFHVVHSLVFR